MKLIFGLAICLLLQDTFAQDSRAFNSRAEPVDAQVGLFIGMIYDSYLGVPYKSGRIEMRQQGQTKYKTHTNAHGEFEFKKVRLGTYEVDIEVDKEMNKVEERRIYPTNNYLNLRKQFEKSSHGVILKPTKGSRGG